MTLVVVAANSLLEQFPPFPRRSTLERANQLDRFTNLPVQSATGEWPVPKVIGENDRNPHGGLKK